MRPWRSSRVSRGIPTPLPAGARGRRGRRLRRRLRDQPGHGPVRADAPLGGGRAPARQAGVRRAGLAAGWAAPDRPGHAGLPRRDRAEAPQVSHRSSLPVDFTLESASEPNAWAIPGHTAMNRGLLQYLENEAQFAFVMGHEMGHVAARHSAARQSRATLGSAGLGILGAAGRRGGARRAWRPCGRRRGSRHPAAPAELRPRSGAPGRPAWRPLHGARRLRSQRGGTRPRGPEPRHRRASRQPRPAPGGSLGHVADPLHASPPRGACRRAPGLHQDAAPTEVRIEGDGRHADRWLRQTEPVRRLAPAYARYDRALQAFGLAAQAARAEAGQRRPGRSSSSLSARSTPRSSSPTRPSSPRSRGTCWPCRGERGRRGARSIALSRSTRATSRRFGRSRGSAASQRSSGRRAPFRLERPVPVAGTEKRLDPVSRRWPLESPRRPGRWRGLTRRQLERVVVVLSLGSSRNAVGLVRRREGLRSLEGGAPAHQHQCHEPDR